MGVQQCSGRGRRWGALLAGGVIAVLAAGCSSSSTSGGSDMAGSAPAPRGASSPTGGAAELDGAAAPDGAAAGSSNGAPGSAAAATTAAAAGIAPAAGYDGTGTSGAGSAQPLVAVDDRQIIRTAAVALRLTVAEGKDQQDTDAALAAAASGAAVKVRALATGNGGYVSAADGGGATVSLTVRIPAPAYDSVMRGLPGVGDVTSRTEQTQDVTDELVDVTSRVATMKASIDRLRTLMTKADKVGDVISIESELTAREADLESLQRRQAALSGDVALSTVTVTISAVTSGTVVTPQDRHGFLAGLAAGWRALISVGTGAAAVAGALLPFLPAAVVIAALVIWLRRRRVVRPIGNPAMGPAGEIPTHE